MQRLQMFTAYELNLLVCGEQTPTWTREDIVNFTEPKFGYTKERCVCVCVCVCVTKCVVCACVSPSALF